MKWELSKNGKSWFVFLADKDLSPRMLYIQGPQIVEAIKNQQSVVLLPEAKWISNRDQVRACILGVLRERGKPMLTGQIFKAQKQGYTYRAIKAELDNLVEAGRIFRKMIKGKIGHGYRYSDKPFPVKRKKPNLRDLEGANEINETIDESNERSE